MTELHQAATSGELNKCHELIEYGADMNAKTNGWTPLHRATNCGYLEVCEVLIKYGADVY